MPRNYAALPWEYLTEMEELEDVEFGRLARALIQYSMTGEPIALTGNERFYARRVMAQEDRYQESYRRQSSANTQNGASGGRPPKSGKHGNKPNSGHRQENKAEESEKKRTKPNETEITHTETETNTETDTDPPYGGVEAYASCASASAVSAPGNEKKTASESEFDTFWAAYPRKTGKGAARTAFRKARQKAGLEVMLSALEVQKRSAQWQRDGGQFIPHPATWLNQERWADEPGIGAPCGSSSPPYQASQCERPATTPNSNGQSPAPEPGAWLRNGQWGVKPPGTA